MDGRGAAGLHEVREGESPDPPPMPPIISTGPATEPVPQPARHRDQDDLRDRGDQHGVERDGLGRPSLVGT